MQEKNWSPELETLQLVPCFYHNYRDCIVSVAYCSLGYLQSEIEE